MHICRTPAAAGRTGYSTTPVWSDEFDGTLDTTKWTAENKAWTDNSELQFYSPDAKYAQNVNGELQITATNDANGGRDYTSARISTKNTMTFKHGLFAARIKMTKGQGIWPAFWMFGTGTKYSEIDVAEMAGGNAALTNPPTGSGDDSAYASLCHFATEDGKQAPVTQGPGNSHHAPAGQVFADDYHVMWLEWTEHEVYSGLDTNDQQTMVADISQLAAFQAHMYLILNVAVGGAYPGNPDATTNFPQTMHVDWVRVYNKNGETITQAVTSDTSTIDPSSPDGSNGGSSSSGGDTTGNSAVTYAAPLFTMFGCALASIFAKLL
jgi:beta-glucanase (GH16 family)